MKEITTYLVFDGNCRQAMEFYKRCLGGELFLMPVSEAPVEAPQEAKDRIMHAFLKSGPIALMGSDRWPGMPYQRGDNFSICIAPESIEETEALFAAMGEKGKITSPLQDTFWGARFGTLVDQFGINWMLNFEKPKAA
ncbi:MAG TPA: VOC family protein [Terriglobia bacterium]|nr:VOC family protein [Terriglobia bacterium]